MSTAQTQPADAKRQDELLALIPQIHEQVIRLTAQMELLAAAAEPQRDRVSELPKP